jgi:hypothetical protein
LRLELAALVLLGAGVLAAPVSGLAADAADAVAAAPGAPTSSQIDAALAKVKADPNLAEEHTVRTLKWKAPEEEQKESSWLDWFKWVGHLFGWIAQSSRVLVWVIIAALIGALAIFVVRIFMSGRDLGFADKFVAPTHVQDLDIRPESLPDDIGAAARALWDSGDPRAALALLYRGLLSRLAHVHEVPIRASSTEGDCLSLAARKLDAARLDYVTRLVRSWQRAIYGGVTLESADVHALCAQFAAHLDPSPAEARAGGFAGATS